METEAIHGFILVHEQSAVRSSWIKSLGIDLGQKAGRYFTWCSSLQVETISSFRYLAHENLFHKMQNICRLFI